MSTNQIEQVISKAVHEAVGRMSIAEVRNMVVAPYVEIRERSR